MWRENEIQLLPLPFQVSSVSYLCFSKHFAGRGEALQKAAASPTSYLEFHLHNSFVMKHQGEAFDNEDL